VRAVRRTLLLNATFEPLCVVSLRRAVVLVLKGKAEIVARDVAELHSARLNVPCPSVIRLVHFVRVPYRSRVPLSRRAVFARDEHRCQYCNRPAENIDHVIPRSRGGEHIWENVVASCRPCNARKENRYLHETDLRLRRPPVAPHSSWVVTSGGPIDPAWQPYLETAIVA
jgi:5-methylcytosine-specific restriction endonuclease McrA